MTLAILEQLAQDMRCRAANLALHDIILIGITRQDNYAANLQRIAQGFFQERDILQLAHIIRKLL